MDKLLNGGKKLWGSCTRDQLVTDKCKFLHKMINDLTCVKKVTDTFNKKKLSGETDCMCPEACYSYEYVMTVSQSKWPSAGFEMDAAYVKFVENNKVKWLQDYDTIVRSLKERLRQNDEEINQRLTANLNEQRFV